MTPLKKKFSKAYAKELLKVAEGDLKTAAILVAHPGGRPENTFFLIQQAIEKAIKAVLCHHELAVPLTHDLAALLAMLPDAVSGPPAEKSLLVLTEFASIRRYEEGKYEYSLQETNEAYRTGENVLAWARKHIQ